MFTQNSNDTSNHEKIIKILIEAEGEAPETTAVKLLRQAVAREDGDETTAKMLLEATPSLPPQLAYQLLTKAIQNKNNKENTVKMLLNHLLPAEDLSQREICELMEAAIKWNHANILDLLLERYRSVLILDGKNIYISLLFKAAENNKKTIINSLLHHIPCKIELTCTDSYKLLYYAIKNNNETIFLNPLLSYTLPPEDIYTLLNEVVKQKNGNGNILRQLLERTPAITEENLYNLLVEALKIDEESTKDIVSILLEKYKGINQYQVARFIEDAIEGNRPNIVQLLLERYPSTLMLDAEDFYRSLLLTAVENNNENIINIVLRHISCDIRLFRGNSYKLLRYAIKNNNETILLHPRLSHFLSERNSYNLLQEAIQQKNENIMEKLLPHLRTLPDRYIDSTYKISIPITGSRPFCSPGEMEEEIVSAHRPQYEERTIHHYIDASHQILLSAVRLGTETMVGMLCTYPPLLTLNQMDYAVLEEAAKRNNENIMKALLNYLHFLMPPTPSHRDYYYKAMSLAINNGNENILRRLLEYTPPLTKDNIKDLFLQAIQTDKTLSPDTPFSMVNDAENNRKSIVKVLLDHASALTQADLYALLIDAVNSAPEDVVDLLIRHIDKVFSQSEQKDNKSNMKHIRTLQPFFNGNRDKQLLDPTPLQQAVTKGRENVIRMLLDAKASVHEKSATNDGKLLALAIKQDYEAEDNKVKARIVQTLLDYGAPVDDHIRELAKNHELTPRFNLDEAVQKAKVNCMERLGLFILNRPSVPFALHLATTSYFKNRNGKERNVEKNGSTPPPSTGPSPRK